MPVSWLHGNVPAAAPSSNYCAQGCKLVLIQAHDSSDCYICRDSAAPHTCLLTCICKIVCKQAANSRHSSKLAQNTYGPACSCPRGCSTVMSTQQRHSNKHYENAQTIQSLQRPSCKLIIRQLLAQAFKDSLPAGTHLRNSEKHPGPGPCRPRRSDQQGSSCAAAAAALPYPACQEATAHTGLAAC